MLLSAEQQNTTISYLNQLLNDVCSTLRPSLIVPTLDFILSDNNGVMTGLPGQNVEAINHLKKLYSTPDDILTSVLGIPLDEQTTGQSRHAKQILVERVTHYKNLVLPTIVEGFVSLDQTYEDLTQAYENLKYEYNQVLIANESVMRDCEKHKQNLDLERAESNRLRSMYNNLFLENLRLNHAYNGAVTNAGRQENIGQMPFSNRTSIPQGQFFSNQPVQKKPEPQPEKFKKILDILFMQIAGWHGSSYQYPNITDLRLNPSIKNFITQLFEKTKKLEGFHGTSEELIQAIDEVLNMISPDNLKSFSKRDNDGQYVFDALKGVIKLEMLQLSLQTSRHSIQSFLPDQPTPLNFN